MTTPLLTTKPYIPPSPKLFFDKSGRSGLGRFCYASGS